MSGTILVVDDNPEIVDRYADILSEQHTVRTAYSGAEALDTFDADIDVVLLDRRMPDLSGDEVLQEIRDRESECRIAMVTAVDPDFDILEMPFDDYLMKPITADEVTATVEQLFARSRLDTQLKRYFALVSKRATLRSKKPDHELATNPEFHELTAEIEHLEAELEETLADIDFEKALKTISAGTDKSH